MSVTLIAKKAGVSIATVSRVLNNSRRVNPESAELVRKAVEELNLPPFKGRKRRSVQPEKSTTIAIVSLGQRYVDWFGIPVMASVVAELTRAAESMHHGVLITEMMNANEVSSVLRRQSVEGAIVFVGENATTRDLVALRSVLPIVRVMGAADGPSVVDHVCVNNHAVGNLAAGYLRKHGVKNPAFITTHPDWPLMRQRGRGFLDTCADAETPATAYVVSDKPHLIESYGTRVVATENFDTLVARLAEGGHDGVFVGNDSTTHDLYQTLARQQRPITEAMRVISCDNEAIRISTLTPKPVSVDLMLTEIARRAVGQLQYRIEHPGEYWPAVTEVSPTLAE